MDWNCTLFWCPQYPYFMEFFKSTNFLKPFFFQKYQWKLDFWSKYLKAFLLWEVMHNHQGGSSHERMIHKSTKGCLQFKILTRFTTKNGRQKGVGEGQLQTIQWFITLWFGQLLTFYVVKLTTKHICEFLFTEKFLLNL